MPGRVGRQDQQVQQDRQVQRPLGPRRSRGAVLALGALRSLGTLLPRGPGRTLVLLAFRAVPALPSDRQAREIPETQLARVARRGQPGRSLRPDRGCSR